MRKIRRASTLAGLLVLALLPVAGASVSPRAEVRTQLPLAIAQPVIALESSVEGMPRLFVESAGLALLGGALMGAAMLLRRSSKLS
jgi:hypothetical protein